MAKNMKQPIQSQPETGRESGFPVTQWSLVSQARETDTHVRMAALDNLLGTYRPVLLRYLVGVWRLKTEQAEDLLQSFMAERILEKQLLVQADRTRGRFRSFLLKCLVNYVKSSFRRDQALKRGPDANHRVNVDDYAESIPDKQAGHQEFDACWARQVLDLAIERMRKDCEAAGRRDLWIMFQRRMLEPTYSNAEPTPYASLVAELGLRSPAQAMNLLITVKRKFRNMLIETIRETVADDADVDREIMELQRALK